MPACRPTANSIWNSFRSSGKRHLILTGGFGSGKTTLLSHLFPKVTPGITSWLEPRKSVLMKDNLSGDTVEIARFDPTLPGPTAKMVLCGDTLSVFGPAVLERCITDSSAWVTIDEIGFLEEKCVPFKESIRKLFDHKQVAAVVRKQDLPFLNELRSREDVFLVDLDAPFGNAGCVIMASGLGKRFGQNKLMVDFMGVPMIERILDATEGLFARRVVVTRHASVAALCRERNIAVVLHDLPHRNDTVRLGLEAIGDVDHCMFCPGDQPLLSRDTIASLLHCAAHAPQLIWRPCCADTPASPVLFPKWSFAELQSLPEGKGGGWVVKNHPAQTAFLHIEHPWELMDADTPEALDALTAIAKTNLNI